MGGSHEDLGYPDWGDKTVSIYDDFDRSIIPYYDHRTCIVYKSLSV